MSHRILPAILVTIGIRSVLGASVPEVRPSAWNRTYTSPTIDALIQELTPLFKDSNMATLFENCLPNTLDTTVLYATDGTDGATLDSFIITGDIEALWLRDSANQVMPYVPYVAEDKKLATLVEGLLARQAASILVDPFANAFNYNASGEGHQNDICKPPMTASVYESKYEIDSPSAFLKLSYWYWRYSKSTDFITSNWLAAVCDIICGCLPYDSMIKESACIDMNRWIWHEIPLKRCRLIPAI